MKITFYILLITFFIKINNVFAADTKFIFELAEKLKSFNENYPEEIVFIQTDKDKYLIGETVWFKAYINDPLFSTSSSLSKKLFIKLIDDDGNEYSSYIFEIKQGKSYGNFIIPGEIDKNELYIIAYSSWMQNGGQLAFIKPITIVNSIIPEILVDINFNPSSEENLNNSHVQVFVKDLNYNPIENAKVNYTLTANKKEYLVGNETTNSEGISTINIPIDNQIKDKLIQIKLSIKHKKLKEQISYTIPKPSLPLIVNFFPEGNDVISGLVNKMAITVSDSNDNYFDFEGKLFNSKNEEVLSFNSLTKGMALLSFTPEEDNYYIKLTSPIQLDEKFKLPKVKKEGVIITNNGQSKIMMYLNVMKKSKEPENYYVIAQKRGQIVYASILSFTDKSLIKLPVEDISNGIVQLLLFDENQNLMTKRNVFIDHSKNITFNNIPDVESKSNSVIQFNVNNDDQLNSIGNYSISIIDKNSLYSDSKIQLIDYQLNNNPEFLCAEKWYSEAKSAEKHVINDCIALTNNDPDYDYNSILAFLKLNKYGNMNLDGYFGRVYDNNENVVSNAKILVLNKITLKSLNLFSDKDGYFYLPFSQYNCKIEDLDMNATNPLNNQKLTIKNLSNNDTEIIESAVQRIHKYQKSSILLNSISNYNSLPPSNYDLYSKIKFDNKSPIKIQEVEPKEEQKNYSNYLSVIEIVSEIKHFDMSYNKIIFPGFHNSINAQQGALIVIDGVKYGDDASVLDNLSPADVGKINVSTSIVDVQRYSGLYSNGLIEVFTKHGEYIPEPKDNTTKIFSPFSLANEFNTPIYETPSNGEEDIRTTIYWNNSLEPDKDGIIKVNCYNGDIKAELIGIITGVSSKGTICSASFNYKIK